MRLGRALEAPERMAPGEVALAGRGVGVEIDGKTIVRRADIEVRVGEVVALVGPNGAGKSTLLGALSGDTPTVSGTVEVAGSDLGGWSGAELALRRSVLPQQVTVSFPFSVRDVVEMGRSPWVAVDGDPEGEAAVDAALHAADVAHLAHRRYPTLSGGERARAALARVLAQAAQVMFLDEPTAALDLHHQEMVLRLVRAAAVDRAAVVVVLHDLGLAAAHADRIVVLLDGAVVADGSPAEVLRPELLSEVYDHPVEVIAHPRTGELLVLPLR